MLILIAQAYFIFRNLNLTKPSICIVKTKVLFFKKATIHAYAVALIVIWKNAFGKEHVMTKTSVIKKLEKLMKSYCNQVYSVFRHSRPRSNSKPIEKKSLRQLNKDWRTSVDSKTVKILDKIATFYALKIIRIFE